MRIDVSQQWRGCRRLDNDGFRRPLCLQTCGLPTGFTAIEATNLSEDVTEKAGIGVLDTPHVPLRRF